MQYLGGKSRIAKPIAAVIRELRGARSVYVEPFLGAGSVALHVAPEFERAFLSDSSVDLMLLWHAVDDGWTPPTDLDEATYRALRHAEPSALRGFAGFPCSFGGKWFGGYARDPKGGRNFAEAASRSMVRRADTLRGAEYRLGGYATALDGLDPSAVVVYADPPYAGTTAYGNVDRFDSAAFWDRMREWSEAGALVLVSEYTAPEGWRAVWSATPTSTLARANHGADGTLRRASEHLYAWRP